MRDLVLEEEGSAMSINEKLFAIFRIDSNEISMNIAIEINCDQ